MSFVNNKINNKKSQVKITNDEKYLNKELSYFNDSDKFNKKPRLNNKFYNLKFITNKYRFSAIAKHLMITSDEFMAYILMPNYKKENFNSSNIPFETPNTSNNYNDLGFLYNGTPYGGIKVCRVKTLKNIFMDGSHTTNMCNPNINYLLFYSLIPSESDKMVLMKLSAYNSIVSLNSIDKLRYFDYTKTKKYKEILGLNDKELYTFENIFSQKNTEEMTENELIEYANIERKYFALQKTMSYLKNNIAWYPKTHFGNQYSAYNIKTHQLLNFRDAQSRDAFLMTNLNIIPNDSQLRNNCKNMDKIVIGESVNDFQANVYEKSGWIILHYIPNVEELLLYVKKLIINLHKYSSKWAKRLEKEISNIKDIIINKIELALKEVYEMRNRCFNYFSFRRPLSLFRSYTTCLTKFNLSVYYSSYDIRIKNI